MCQSSPKISLNMIQFYFNQIGRRLKYIGPVNVPETRLNISRMDRLET